MVYAKKVKFTVTGTYGCAPAGEDDVYTIDEFKDYCDSGAFIDYDGYGYPVKDKLADEEIYIIPSRLDLIPNDATHIIWFNR